MQYSSTFGRGRFIKSVLVGLAFCLAVVSSAEAAKRHNRHAARYKAHRVASTGDGIVGSPRYAAIVVDDKTGKVLYAKNADAPRHPASLTKMMTLYILFEEMKRGKVGPNTRFTASAKASVQPPTKLGLRPGQTIAVEDAIRALVTKSANDAAVTIAENLGGTEEAFARRMTATARKLGMRGTTFYNASGLPNDAQYTTARDMVILGRALQERFPSQYRYFATRSFAWGNSVHGNHNKLLFRLEGIDGIKTGYTNASGFNLVSSYRRDGRHLVAAVLGGSSGQARDDHMARLLTTYIGQAAGGSKVSSVFDENGIALTADAGEIVPDETPIPVRAPAALKVAAAPMPAPARASQAYSDEEEPADAGRPMALAAVVAPAPIAAPAPVAASAPSANKPRIAASDIVPIAPPERDPRRSTDHGAAVAMARAILLPDAGRPMAPSSLPPVRTAAVSTSAMAPAAPLPAPVAAPQVEVHPAKPPSLADVTVTHREVAAVTTGSLARPRVEEPPPPPVAKAVHHTGWLVQIGAYDNEKAARAALDKAKGKGGSVLARAEGFAEQATTGSGRVWRARFAGFADQKRADDACKALKRKDFACLALRQ